MHNQLIQFRVEWSGLCAAIVLMLSLFATLSMPSSLLAQDADSPIAADYSLKIYEFRMVGDDQRMRVLLHFDDKPDFTWFLLRSPHRLVVDLPKTEFAIDDAVLEGRGLVSSVRYGSMAEEQSRIIFTLKSSFSVEDIAVQANENAPGYRLVLDLVSATEADFEKTMLERMDAAAVATVGVEAAPDEAAAASIPEQDTRFTIAIDPGHGGIDGGAVGKAGTEEKVITLTFGLELKRKLEENEKYRVVLTRNSDVFLRLDERVRIAREGRADLLISIHADSIRLKDFRGSTIYTLSERASDAEAAATAARENLSDEFAGLGAPETRNDVADILADLIRRETHGFSIQFSRTLAAELSETAHLVNNPLRSAGFRILRAHDVPSILLELGYLSNAEDEKQLQDPKWRERATSDIVRAIEMFADAKQKSGG